MFDPYRKWLGIPANQQPPTYYQLLNISPDETDAKAIDEAAKRQTAYLRTHQSGPYAKDCARMLNEVAQARATLLNAAKRKEYDAHLAANRPKRVSAPAQPAADLDLNAQPRVPTAAQKRPKPAEARVPIAKKGSFLTKPMLYGMIGGVVGVILLVVLIMAFTGGDEEPPTPTPVANVDDTKNSESPVKPVPPVTPEAVTPVVEPPKADVPKEDKSPLVIEREPEPKEEVKTADPPKDVAAPTPSPPVPVVDVKPTEPPAPAADAPPFIDHGEFVEETRTGLLWQKDGDDSGKLNFTGAQKYAAELNLGGVIGWRLPSPEELLAIFPATAPPFIDTKYSRGAPFKRTDMPTYWAPRENGSSPVYIEWYAVKGRTFGGLKDITYCYVRCVHDPIKGGIAKPPAPGTAPFNIAKDGSIHRVDPNRGTLGGATLSADGSVGYFSAGKVIFKVDLKAKKVTEFLPDRKLSEFDAGLKLLVSPDGAVLASADERELNIFDTSTGNVFRNMAILGQQAMAFSPNSKVLMVSRARKELNPDGSQRYEKGVPIWSGSTVLLFEAPEWDNTKRWTSLLFPVQAMAAAADGSIVAADPYAVRKWFPATGRQGVLFAVRHTNLAFTIDGKHLFGTEPDGTRVVTWDMAGKVPRPMYKGWPIFRLSVSADGQTTLTSSEFKSLDKEKGTVNFWSNAPGKSGGIRNVSVHAIDQALSADGKIALVTADDGNVRLFDRDAE